MATENGEWARGRRSPIFGRTLQNDDAEAVQRITRDPVVLDFVQLAEGAKERDLEAALLADIELFMLALSEGFYFAGRQKSLQVGGEELTISCFPPRGLLALRAARG